MVIKNALKSTFLRKKLTVMPTHFLTAATISSSSSWLNNLGRIDSELDRLSMIFFRFFFTLSLEQKKSNFMSVKTRLTIYTYGQFYYPEILFFSTLSRSKHFRCPDWLTNFFGELTTIENSRKPKEKRWRRIIGILEKIDPEWLCSLLRNPKIYGIVGFSNFFSEFF